jgi:hypothetical protein
VDLEYALPPRGSRAGDLVGATEVRPLEAVQAGDWVK